MKARRISTGEVVEVTELTYTSMKTNAVYRRDIKNGGFIAESDLEFLPDIAEKVIEGWVARDKDGALNLFDREPERVAECAWAYYPGHTLGFLLPKDLFPEVTWDSEPLKVKLTLTPMK